LVSFEVRHQKVAGVCAEPASNWDMSSSKTSAKGCGWYTCTCIHCTETVGLYENYWVQIVTTTPQHLLQWQPFSLLVQC